MHVHNIKRNKNPKTLQGTNMHPTSKMALAMHAVMHACSNKKFPAFLYNFHTSLKMN